MSNSPSTTTTPTPDPIQELAKAPDLAQFTGMIGSSIAT